MESPVLLNARELTPALLSQLALEVETRPELSRTRLAREVCEWLDWKGTDGEPKITSCRMSTVTFCDGLSFTLYDGLLDSGGRGDGGSK